MRNWKKFCFSFACILNIDADIDADIDASNVISIFFN